MVTKTATTKMIPVKRIHVTLWKRQNENKKEKKYPHAAVKHREER